VREILPNPVLFSYMRALGDYAFQMQHFASIAAFVNFTYSVTTYLLINESV